MFKSAVCYSLGLRAQEASAYIRIVAPLKRANVKIIDGISSDANIDLDLIREGDVVFVQRDFPKHFDSFCVLVDKCRSYKKSIIFDLDDLLFELPEDHYDRLKYSFTPYLLPIYYAIQEADLVTVPTYALKEYLSSINDNVVVLPNYLDDQLWRPRYPTLKRNDKIIIGYVGTVTHYEDLRSISSSLLEVLETFRNNVELRVWGFEPPPELSQHPSVSYSSLFHISYPAFASWLQNTTFDVGIAPIRDNLFNRCKSGLKFLEYSVNGIASVAANLDPYNKVITNRYNGLLVDSVEDWRVAIGRLIEDDSLRFKLAFHALETLKHSWTLSANIEHWLSVIANGLNNSEHQRKSNFIIKSIAKQSLEWMANLQKLNPEQPASRSKEMKIYFKPSTCSMDRLAEAKGFELNCYDATSQVMHFDPRWLEVVQYAPAWMTRSERLLLFSLIFSLRPKRYLEIGTFQGGSALIVCSALDALESDARMYLVDPTPKIAPENWDRLRHRAKLYQGCSPEILKVAAEEAGGGFDFILIDGDHSYGGVMRDAEGVLPYAEVGSYIIFHDSFYDDVGRAIDDFVTRYSDRILDLGILTREFTSQTVDNTLIRWGGLRLNQVIAKS